MNRTAAIAALPTSRVITPTAKHRRYGTYASSGSPWLPDLPSHWKIRRLKFVARSQPSNVDKKSADGEIPVRLCNYVDVYKNDYITPELDFMQATADTVELAKFQLRRGDVLITKDSEEWNDIAVPAFVTEDFNDVACGYHLSQVRPRLNMMDGEYLFRAFRASGVAEQFHVRANGITRFGLAAGAIGDVMFPVPPIDEQRTIAAFLRHETARIDALIAKKERLVDLLQEKRAALISHAVTKGLNRNAPMKDSGVPWIGTVPTHWEVLPLRRRWEVIDCKHRTVPFLDSGIPLASIGEVQSVELDLSKAKKTSEEEYTSLIENDRQPRRGDIIYSRNATVGAAAYVNTDEVFCMGQDVCMIRSRQQDQRYLTYQLRSPPIIAQLDQIMIGATFKRINVADIKAFIVVCPPVAEQNEIGVFCFTVSARLQGLIDAVTTAINHLAEYRSTLISFAVTGKIDVRCETVDNSERRT